MTTKHGHAKRSGLSPTYWSWKAMLTRCTNPRSPKFPAYGGRGIKVCPRWQSFEAFLTDMGQRPVGKTLDRIDVNGGYEPANCRWATAEQQSMNKTNSRIEELQGEHRTVAEWAAVTGIPHSTLRMRLHRGWTFERAATTPLRGSK